MSIVRYDAHIAIGGGGMATFDWGNLSSFADPTPHFELTAGGDIQINTAGVYALHWVASEFSMIGNAAEEYQAEWNLTSGGPVRFSSQTSGSVEGGAYWGAKIEDLSGIDVSASGQAELFSYLFITTGAALPCIIQCQADRLRDGVSIADTLQLYCTGVRFGAGDE